MGCRETHHENRTANQGTVNSCGKEEGSFFRRVVAVKPLSREGDEPDIASGA